MLSHKLFQIYKQYPCCILSLFVVLYETRYDQHNYFLVLKTSIIDPFTLNKVNQNMGRIYKDCVLALLICNDCYGLVF